MQSERYYVKHFFILFEQVVENSIEIKRTNFQRKSDYFQLLMYMLCSVLGVVSIFWDWKASIPAVMCTIFGFIAVALLLSWIFHLSFGLFVLQCALFATVKLAISKFREIGQDHTDIIFSLNAIEFSCLCPENSDYKGYAINPMGYKKRFQMADIRSVQRDRKNLLIVLKEQLVRPRELRQEEIELILTYFRKNKAALIHAVTTERILQEEDRVYWIKLIVFALPCLLAVCAIYIFADNGRNSLISVCIIIGAILVAVILLKITNLIYHHGEKK
ncbi:hypothetical protein [Sphingobacterium multivorum]|uniref:hypothetical protein n=1 Tax=Sphingobacterium multivorum TaxID=28454 RepID=UPI00289C4D6B|nr:hypothetical protein [Sphingobacterium multivorum]